MSLVIGLTGKAGCGKDTLAALFKRYHSDQNVRLMAFASALKRRAGVVFDEPMSAFYDTKDAMSKWGMTYRALLQKFGTEFAREMIDKDFWVKTLDYEYNSVCSNADVVVITDVRFDNEAEWVLAQGGFIVEIHRGQASDLTEQEMEHASEAGVGSTMIGGVIWNNSAPEAMVDSLNMIITSKGF